MLTVSDQRLRDLEDLLLGVVEERLAVSRPRFYSLGSDGTSSASAGSRLADELGVVSTCASRNRLERWRGEFWLARSSP